MIENPKHLLRNNSSDWWRNLSTESKNFYKDNLFKGYKFITMGNIDSAYLYVSNDKKFFGEEGTRFCTIAFN